MSSNLTISNNLSVGNSISTNAITTNTVQTSTLTCTNLNVNNGNLNLDIQNLNVNGEVNTESISNNTSITSDTLNSRVIVYKTNNTNLETEIDGIKIDVSNNTSAIQELQLVTSDMSYDPLNDRTTFNNNLQITQNNNLLLATNTGNVNVLSTLNQHTLDISGVNARTTGLTFDISTTNVANNMRLTTNKSLLLDTLDVGANITSINTKLTGITYDNATGVTNIANSVRIPAGKTLFLNNLDLSQNIVSINNTLNGISYNATGDLTLVDNNVTISSGKSLKLGTVDISQSLVNLDTRLNTANNDISSNKNLITLARTDISSILTRISDINYNSANDTTSVDNNLIIYGKNDGKTTPNEALQIVDISEGQCLSIIPKAIQGNYNSVVQNDDVLILARDNVGPIDTGLALTTWNSKPHGLRIHPISTYIGCSNSTYTTSGTAIPATNVFINSQTETVDINGLNKVNTNIGIRKQVMFSQNFPVGTSANSGSSVTFGTIVYANTVRRIVTVSVPVSIFSDRRTTSAVNNVTITDTVSALSIQINRNGSTYVTNPTISTNPTLPLTRRFVGNLNSTTPSSELFLTTLSFSFLIDSESNLGDSYTFIITPTVSSTYSFSTSLISPNNFGIKTNGTVTIISNGVNDNIQGVLLSTYAPIKLGYEDVPYITSLNDKIETPTLSSHTIVTSNMYSDLFYGRMPGIPCGWMIDDSAGVQPANAYYPILCSTRRTIQDNTDFVLVLPKYRMEFYRNDNYVSLISTCNNMNGTDALLFNLQPNSNAMSSVKVFYKPFSNVAEREITIVGIS